MSFVILELQGEHTAKDLESWDWPLLLDEPNELVYVNAFDSAEEMVEAITRGATLN